MSINSFGLFIWPELFSFLNFVAKPGLCSKYKASNIEITMTIRKTLK